MPRRTQDDDPNFFSMTSSAKEWVRDHVENKLRRILGYPKKGEIPSCYVSKYAKVKYPKESVNSDDLVKCPTPGYVYPIKDEDENGNVTGHRVVFVDTTIAVDISEIPVEHLVTKAMAEVEKAIEDDSPKPKRKPRKKLLDDSSDDAVNLLKQLI